jgi:hypothetical protein
MSREVARYTYTKGSRAEGVATYDDDTSCTSHHDTDPARGTHNAFDLVRLHRFGHLDKDAGDLPMKDRPSFKAMIEFAAGLPELAAKPGEEFTDLGPLSADDAWLNTDPPAKPAKRKRFQAFSAREFMNLPPQEWIVADVLPAAELAIVLGPSGAGKTFFCMDMANAITRGIDWCGRKVCKGRVVYVVLEGTRGFAGRLRAYSEAAGISPDELPTIITDAPNLIDSKDALELAAAIGKADVCYVDTMSRAHMGNENTGEDMGKLVNNCQLLHKLTGAMVVLLHHPPHDGERARGWSGLTGAADAIIVINKQGEGLTTIRSAATSTLKDGVEGPLFNFRINERGLFELVSGGAVVPTGSKLPKEGTDIRSVYDAIALLIRQNAGAVDLRDAQAAAVASMPEPLPGEDDRRLQRVNEDIKKLEKRKLFFRVDGKLSDTRLVRGGDFDEAG